MIMPQPQLPTVRPTRAALPVIVVEQLRASIKNWNARYGTPIQAVGFEVLGKIATDDERSAVIQWISANSVFPIGNIFEPKTLRVVSMDEVQIVTPEDRAGYAATISDLVAIGDYVMAMKWEDSAGQEFTTLTIADREGIKYDSLLMGIVTAAKGRPTSTGARTDCEWWRFGWIWQTEFDDMTRGEVQACLTVVCDNAGNAIDCLTSKHCFMQLGSCDVEIADVTRDENCCRAECAWGVATATVEAKVTLEAGKLKVEFKGTFGSESKGGRTLRDCCPPRRIGRTLARVPFHKEEVVVAALRSGAPIDVAREIAEAVWARVSEYGTYGMSTARGLLLEELRSRNPKWEAAFVEQEREVDKRGIDE